VYIYIYIYVYIRIYTYIYLYIHICVNICTLIYTNTDIIIAIDGKAVSHTHIAHTHIASTHQPEEAETRACFRRRCHPDRGRQGSIIKLSSRKNTPFMTSDPGIPKRISVPKRVAICSFMGISAHEICRMWR